jgi:uncharacterized protein (TIGR03083 family)
MHTTAPPIDVVHLLPVLDEKLLELLRSLKPSDWEKQTVAKLWTVKDVAAHLLDGNIRILSIFRDGHFGGKASYQSFEELVQILNGMNADWVRAMKRVSPDMLISLLEITGRAFCDYFETLDPYGKSVFPVDWAGESESRNWMEIAREYTEKWLHQQQIRDAVNHQEIMTKELFYPFIDIFMKALPHTFRDTPAAEGSVIKVTVTTEIGGSWFLQRKDAKWHLTTSSGPAVASEVLIDPDTAWKLFSKSLRPADVNHKISITGNRDLGAKALHMVSVMA